MVTLTVLLTLAIAVGMVLLAFIGIIAIPLIDIAIAVAIIWLCVTILSFIAGIIFGRNKKEKEPD